MHEIQYDLEPPPFCGPPESLAILRQKPSRCKNPSRPVKNQFCEPVRLALRLVDGVSGHYNTSTHMFWPQSGRLGVETDPALVDVIGPESVRIPRGAVCMSLEDATITSDTCFEFYDFSLPHPVPCVLYAAGPGGPSSLPRLLGEFMEGVADVGDLASVEGHSACSQFQEAAESRRWVLLTLTLHPTYRSRSPEIAHRLCAQAWTVSVPLLPGCAPPKTRVQASILRWVKDTEVSHALSKFADSMPGMTKSAAAMARPLTWDDAVYDDDFNVSRSMMSWGALAAWLCKGRTLADFADLHDVCEPLASYLGGVLQVQEQRVCGPRGGTTPVLRWNSPQKMTSEQCLHGAAMFYWSAIHRDDGTRAVSKAICKRSLEMYLRFGHVFLRKRAYQFHGDKRKREE